MNTTQQYSETYACKRSTKTGRPCKNRTTDPSRDCGRHATHEATDIIYSDPEDLSMWDDEDTVIDITERSHTLRRNIEDAFEQIATRFPDMPSATMTAARQFVGLFDLDRLDAELEPEGIHSVYAWKNTWRKGITHIRSYHGTSIMVTYCDDDPYAQDYTIDFNFDAEGNMHVHVWGDRSD